MTEAPGFQAALFYECIGREVRDTRIACGITQRELARDAGMGHWRVSHIERGLLEDMQSLQKVCDVLGISAPELLRHAADRAMQ